MYIDAHLLVFYMYICDTGGRQRFVNNNWDRPEANNWVLDYI